MKRCGLVATLWRRTSSAILLSGGLVMLLAALLMMVDLWTGFLSDRAVLQRAHARNWVAASAPLVIEALASDEAARLPRLLQALRVADGPLLSMAVRERNGVLRAQVGAHPLNWGQEPGVEAVRLPLFKDGEAHTKPYGFIEYRFRAAAEPFSLAWWRQPAQLTAVSTVLLCLPLFVAYLWRVLVQLDPSRAVPEQVRNAFDSFVEAVVVVDTKGRVLMSNRAARELLGAEEGLPDAMLLGETPLLRGAFSGSSAPPWRRAMLQSQAQEREELVLEHAGRKRFLRLSCAPIIDGPGAVKGCMVTVMDETSLQSLTRDLVEAMLALENSRAQISAQNKALKRLATRDTMTNTLNRRALFERAEEAFASAREEAQPLACIMADIDHFKQFNDQFGHGVGDQVIVSFAKVLRAGVRDSDLLGRYGGEEFCILLRGASTVAALRRAEALRKGVEKHAGARVEVDGVAMHITASFGVAMLSPEIGTLKALVEAADAALYEAKRGGRNRVSLAAERVHAGR